MLMFFLLLFMQTLYENWILITVKIVLRAAVACLNKFISLKSNSDFSSVNLLLKFLILFFFFFGKVAWQENIIDLT